MSLINNPNLSHNQQANISNFTARDAKGWAMVTRRRALGIEDRKVWSGMDGAARGMMQLNSISLNPDNSKRKNQNDSWYSLNLNNNPQNPILYASLDTPGYCMRKYAQAGCGN